MNYKWNEKTSKSPVAGSCFHFFSPEVGFSFIKTQKMANFFANCSRCLISVYKTWAHLTTAAEQNGLSSYFWSIYARMSLSDKEQPVQTWISMDGEHKPAFRMLYYWTQINDMVRFSEKATKFDEIFTLRSWFCGLIRIYELGNRSW